MVSLLPRPIEVLAATLLTVIYAAPSPLLAQSHVVSPAEAQKQVMAASQTRQHNEDTVRQFVSSPQAEKAIKAAGMIGNRDLLLILVAIAVLILIIVAVR